MKKHMPQLKYPKGMMIAAIALVLVVVAIGAWFIFPEPNTAITQRVKLNTDHRIYNSVDEMIAYSDTDFVGRAVVLDDGTVRSREVTKTPADAPPIVHTDYRLEVKFVVKGKDITSQITVATMGGQVGDTLYTYDGVPKLEQGDTIVLFATLGDDGKYYPLAGSTAIAVENEPGVFSLSRNTINTGGVTFTKQDIARWSN